MISTFSKYLNKFIPAITVIITSCAFDINIPLQNDIPKCINYSCIQKDINYPDSAVCTLKVSDLNDSHLNILFKDSNDISGKPVKWPGTVTLLDENYNLKDIVLSLPGNKMQIYNGNIIIKDSYDSESLVPCKIKKYFIDPFDTFPLSKNLWRKYNSDDTSYFRYDYLDHKLQFEFGLNQYCISPSGTGIVSEFQLDKDFSTSIEFELRNEMTDGFEINFFVSNSQDTGRWTGDKAGIRVSGNNGRIDLECRSVQFQSYSTEGDLNKGEYTKGLFKITRNDSTMNFIYYNGNPQDGPVSLTKLYYHANTPVYVHINMKVSDCLKPRHCVWKNFRVDAGNIKH